MTAWVTPAAIGSAWPDAARLPAVDVEFYLEAAQDDCIRYMPAEEVPAEGDPVLARLRLACILHARDLHAATTRTGDLETAGDPSFAFRVRPLSDAVKALLRPPAGRPRFGSSRTTVPSTAPVIDGGDA